MPAASPLACVVHVQRSLKMQSRVLLGWEWIESRSYCSGLVSIERSLSSEIVCLCGQKLLTNSLSKTKMMLK